MVGIPGMISETSHLSGVDMEKMEIDRYDIVLEKGKPTTYAVKGKQRYHIPDAFAGMCDDKHLAIAKAQTVMEELYDTAGDYWVPLRTAD